MNTTLNVPGISCDHCKKTIEGAVGQLDGIGMVEVDIASGPWQLTSTTTP